MSGAFRSGQGACVARSRASAILVALSSAFHVACSSAGFAPVSAEGGDTSDAESVEASPVIVRPPETGRDASAADGANADALGTDVVTADTASSDAMTAEASPEASVAAPPVDAGAPCDGASLTGDPNNCGACGNVCTTTVANAVPACTNGSCTVACAPKFHACGTGAGTTCADDTSTASCGSSCTPCAGPPSGATEACTAATDGGAYACGWSCTSPLSACGSSCVNLESDNDNCGTCGNKCSTQVTNATDTCQGGACHLSCNGGYHMCTFKTGSACSDDTSPQSCGTSCTPCTPPAGATATCVPSAGAYACSFSCNAGLAQCGSACVDFTSDANNCGACGHSCGPGTCSSGQCQPWAVSPVTAASTPYFLASDGKYVAWGDLSSKSCSLATVSGNGPFPFGSGGIPYGTALVSGRAACVIQAGSDIQLWTVVPTNLPASSRPTVTLTGADAGNAFGLALDPLGNSAYLTDQLSSGGMTSSLTSIYTCNLGPTPSCNQVNYFPSTSGGRLATNGVNLYVAEGGNGTVGGLGLGGGGWFDVASGQGTVYAVGIDSTSVYWSGEGSSTSAIGRAPLFGSSVTPVLTGVVGAIAAVGSDGMLVYFAVQPTSGASYVASVPVAGGTPTTIYTASSSGRIINDLVYAGGAVFWTESDASEGNGAVYGLRVP
ncbi:MAG TPA: hypothetical protein VKU41_12355 [Polyangiaceae bacterium]|nr:hypothetical protein [Polyangiaceae bacterium]